MKYTIQGAPQLIGNRHARDQEGLKRIFKEMVAKDEDKFIINRIRDIKIDIPNLIITYRYYDFYDWKSHDLKIIEI